MRPITRGEVWDEGSSLDRSWTAKFQLLSISQWLVWCCIRYVNGATNLCHDSLGSILSSSLDCLKVVGIFRTCYPQLIRPDIVTYECFITSGSLRMSTTSSASSRLKGRMSSLAVLVAYLGSTITMIKSYKREGRA